MHWRPFGGDEMFHAIIFVDKFGTVSGKGEPTSCGQLEAWELYILNTQAN